MNIKVSAVVVTYNRLSLLKECISKLLSQSYSVNNIIIINNNSSDGTKEYLNSLDNERIIYKNLDKNLGGAGGFNIGTKLAYNNTNSDYIWLMDDDSMPTKTALSNLLKKAIFLKNRFGFLCSNVRWWKNGAPCNVPKVALDWTRDIDKSLIKVRQATFVSILIPRFVVRKLGLPIKEMFIWGDDTEYTTRLSNYLPSYFVSNSIIMHKSKSNKSYETIFNASPNRIKFYKYMFRNLIYIDGKYNSYIRKIYDIIKFTFILFEIPFKSKNHVLTRMMSMLKSIVLGIIFHPYIEYPGKRN